MSKIAVLGMSAYNNIMLCPTNLKELFSKNNESCSKISYELSDLKKQIGGNGLNISYNLALLGSQVKLFSVIGNDFEFDDFLKENVDLKHILKSDDLLTSRFYITYDDNQTKLSSFFLGASILGADLLIDDFKDISLLYVGAFHTKSMISNLALAKQNNVKTIFSPSFVLNSMTKEDILESFLNTDILIINSSDYDLIKQKAELNDEDMISFFDNLIITYGINGSKIFDRNYHMIEIPGVANPDFIDDVGVSDAFKAGILKGLNDNYDIKTRVSIGAVMSSIATQNTGSTNHKIDWEKFGELYTDTFGTKL